MPVITTSLDSLRNTLIRLEDTIIFALIERAQFGLNDCIYKPNHFQGIDESFLDYILGETEKLHAKLRRYNSPEEYPFTTHFPLPDPILPTSSPKDAIQEDDYDHFLFPNKININDKIKEIYITEILHKLSKDKQDEDHQYGNSATCDIEALQAISKRIHFGKFIAESKFRSNPEAYRQLALKQDRQEINRLLTNEQVEQQVLDRLHQKALVYSSNTNNIDVEGVVELYKKWVIPLTKSVQVDYLINRGQHYIK
ncbi:chorismate mutase [Backusella circina FSU 941]|nr:chorismate mutase [Backusella circina FSU 941]